MILKVKNRDKRLTKYEAKIASAIKSIADQQEEFILSQVKDTKSLSVPKIDFSKYKTVWLMKLAPIMKMLTQEE